MRITTHSLKRTVFHDPTVSLYVAPINLRVGKVTNMPAIIIAKMDSLNEL